MFSFANLAALTFSPLNIPLLAISKATIRIVIVVCCQMNFDKPFAQLPLTMELLATIYHVL